MYTCFIKHISLQLRKEQHTEWEQHTTETSQLREKLAEVTADLHQRNLAMASLTERAASMERQLRDQDEVSERKNAELEVQCITSHYPSLCCFISISLTHSRRSPRYLG